MYIMDTLRHDLGGFELDAACIGDSSTNKREIALPYCIRLIAADTVRLVRRGHAVYNASPDFADVDSHFYSSLSVAFRKLSLTCHHQRREVISDGRPVGRFGYWGRFARAASRVAPNHARCIIPGPGMKSQVSGE